MNFIKEIDFKIDEFKSLEKYPKKLWYKGNTSLLKRPKVSIVGSRRPIQYTQNMVKELASKLSKRGVVVVSGAAMGVDIISHIGAGFSNTIAIMANGLDIRYPMVNNQIIKSIEEDGLVLSQFEEGKKASKWSFVVRNELVVALGEVLIVAQADIDSGSMRSVEYALKAKKDILYFPIE